MISPAKLPRFLECEDPQSGRLFVLHTETPRLICELMPDYSLVWLPGWGDPLPPDYPAARLMREMGDWYAAIDQAEGD